MIYRTYAASWNKKVWLFRTPPDNDYAAGKEKLGGGGKKRVPYNKKRLTITSTAENSKKIWNVKAYGRFVSRRCRVMVKRSGRCAPFQKLFQEGKQAAFLVPTTILAQHITETLNNDL